MTRRYCPHRNFVFRLTSSVVRIQERAIGTGRILVIVRYNMYGKDWCCPGLLEEVSVDYDIAMFLTLEPADPSAQKLLTNFSPAKCYPDPAAPSDLVPLFRYIQDSGSTVFAHDEPSHSSSVESVHQRSSKC